MCVHVQCTYICVCPFLTSAHIANRYITIDSFSQPNIDVSNRLWFFFFALLLVFCRNCNLIVELQNIFELAIVAAAAKTS